ncbi:extracellular superoxide dismutase [Cu-Zn]-like [Stegostoma tigrinum]|uniref:extracellular superoxide dismutase [Cu-Zn]-like n=1 Tax=Stegostoma tigrinum TaxID=3053191 RepID=UPI00202B3BE8|nr:extracellular superoxide dismutase [Cu-Zn]-like [Stegostoma tigrinum]
MKGLNGTALNLYSSGLQLLLLAGTLALQVPQALGYFNAKAIAGMADQIRGTWLKLRPTMLRQNVPGIFAVCNIQPSSDLSADQPAISGTILFYQNVPGSNLEAYFDLQGFPLNDSQSERAIHVHQFGDLSGGCVSTGPHFNPFGVDHPNHPGDFDNFKVRNGRITKFLTKSKADLYGIHTIVGRGVVVHEGKDDLGLGGNPGSLESGNSGRRLACCTIGLSNGNLWKRMVRKEWSN